MSSFQGLFYTLFYITGTVHGVLSKGDVLISGVSSLRGSTVLYSHSHTQVLTYSDDTLVSNHVDTHTCTHTRELTHSPLVVSGEKSLPHVTDCFFRYMYMSL